MSNLLKNQPTPKAKKVLKLEIEINQPEYDEDGQIIHHEEEEEDVLDNFDEYFNAHLLDEEYLDQQSYKGSMTDNESSSSTLKQQQKEMNEQERQDDIKRHLNVDFGDND